MKAALARQLVERTNSWLSNFDQLWRTTWDCELVHRLARSPWRWSFKPVSPDTLAHFGTQLALSAAVDGQPFHDLPDDRTRAPA